MKLKISLQDGFSKTYLPLQFRAFWNDEGYCYLKAQVINGKIIFFCAQLMNYYNTSITNAVESVREAAINQLIKDGALRIQNRSGVFDLFKSSQRKSKELIDSIYDYINKNSVWVEYYESSMSITDYNRYSLVSFVGNSDPDWTPISLDKLESQYPMINFKVDKEDLENWRDARLSTLGIKKILKEKNWTMKEVATRWNRSESWMSKIVNDEARELYWEDAFKGLPSKTNEPGN
ncbi:hypothetical protein ACAD17_004555 [Enterobacter ludwigii]